METITARDMERAAGKGLITMTPEMEAYRAIVNVMAEKSVTVRARIVTDWSERIEIQQAERDTWDR